MLRFLLALCLVLPLIAGGARASGSGLGAFDTQLPPIGDGALQLAAVDKDIWRVVQLYLKDLGLYKGRIDGLPGRGTKRAWAAYARRRGLNPNHIERDAFLQLKSEALARRQAILRRPQAPTSAQGQTTAAAKPASDRELWRGVQTHLRTLGLYKGRIDGLPGRATKRAWTAFAREHGLSTKTIDYDSFQVLKRAATRAQREAPNSVRPNSTASEIVTTRLSESFQPKPPKVASEVNARPKQGGPVQYMTIGALAQKYIDDGRPELAEQLYLKVIDGAGAQLGEINVGVLAAMKGLADFYLSYLMLNKAEKYYLLTIEAQSRVIGRENSDTIKSIYGLGTTYFYMSKYTDAENVLRPAINTARRVLGRSSGVTLGMINNLAAIYVKHGRYEAASDLFKEVLQITIVSPSATKENLALAVNNFAYSLIYRGMLDEAESIYREVMPNAINDLDPEDPTLAVMVYNIASIKLLKKQPKQFLELYNSGIGFAEISYGQYSKLVIDFNKSLTISHIASGDINNVTASFENVLDLIKIRAEKFGKIDGKPGTQLHLYNFAHIEHSDIARLGFAGNQWDIYGPLDFTLKQLGQRLELSNPNAAALLRAIQETQETLESLQTRLGQQLVLGKAPIARDLSNQVKQKSRELSMLKDRLRREFDAISSATTPSIVPLDKAQALLDPGEALVMFARGMEDDDGLYSWLVTNTDVNFKRVDVSREKLERLIDLARPKELAAVSNDTCLLQQVVSDQEARSVDLCASHDLYKALFGPHQDLLQDVSNLFVVTGDDISEAPFHSLLTQEARPGSQPAWLARDMAVTWLPTVTTLEVMRSTKLRGGVARKPFFGIAPVQFDAFSVATGDGRRAPLNDLGGTFAEVNEVADLLGYGQSALKLEGQATESFVKSADLRAYDVVSFATHGLKASEVAQLTQNKLSQPALLLRPDSKEDGILTSAEAAGLLLDANWVILSACNTAAGDGSDGSVGLSGLARSFFFAGARSLLVSHWAADDNASVYFMTQALSNWKQRGLSKAEAVRQARLATMQRPGWEHPYYWSVFSLVGDNL